MFGAASSAARTLGDQATSAGLGSALAGVPRNMTASPHWAWYNLHNGLAAGEAAKIEAGFFEGSAPIEFYRDVFYCTAGKTNCASHGATAELIATAIVTRCSYAHALRGTCRRLGFVHHNTLAFIDNVARLT